jgi:hypothetical protein
VNRVSVSDAQRTVFCNIPLSWLAWARAKPANAAGIPRKTTTSPAVMPMTQTTIKTR